jgi:hypothetical protein
MAQLRLSCADGLPQGIPDEAQLRDFRRDPILARIEARHALTCARVFDIALAIPDEAADVEFIVE